MNLTDVASVNQVIFSKQIDDLREGSLAAIELSHRDFDNAVVHYFSEDWMRREERAFHSLARQFSARWAD